jgi:hypothetical protein
VAEIEFVGGQARIFRTKQNPYVSVLTQGREFVGEFAWCERWLTIMTATR